MHLPVTGNPGHWKSEVSKRIDIFAAALFQGMSVDGLILISATRFRLVALGTLSRWARRQGCAKTRQAGIWRRGDEPPKASLTQLQSGINVTRGWDKWR